MKSEEKFGWAVSILFHSVLTLIFLYYPLNQVAKSKESLIEIDFVQQEELENVESLPEMQKISKGGQDLNEKNVSDVGTKFIKGKYTYKKRDTSLAMSGSVNESEFVGEENNSISTIFLGDKGMDIYLKGRNVTFVPKVEDNSQLEGKVVVEIIVNKFGNVISATPGARGSTTSHPSLLVLAKRSALNFKFDFDNEFPEEQRGYITFSFLIR